MGQYTAQSGYRFLAKENSNSATTVSPNHNDQVWKLVWGLSIPNKVKNFFWRACRDAMPAKVNLQKRKILLSGVCDHCKKDSESILHALWDCLELAQTWRSCPEFEFHPSHRFSNISDIMLYAQREGKHLEELAMLLCAICFRRNQIRAKNIDYLISQVALNA